MKNNSRQLQIMKLLGNVPAMSIRNIAGEIGVSEMTIRRDLKELLSIGYISLIQGVALLNKNTDGTSIVKDYSLGVERQSMHDEKMRIGKMAASLIESEDTIMIDTGTTTEQLLNFLPDGIPLTFVVNNINTLYSVKDRDHSDIYLGGGFFHRNTQMFECQESIALINRIAINKFFVSAAGISSKGTVSCIEQHELPTKHAGIKSALVRILMADSSKFGKIRPCMFASLSDFDVIITDTGIDQAWHDVFQNYGIKFILA